MKKSALIFNRLQYNFINARQADFILYLNINFMEYIHAAQKINCFSQRIL